MALLGVCFEISTDCPKCKAALPLNRASENVLCDGCRTPLETAPGFWETIVGEQIAASMAMAENEGSNSTMMLSRYGLTVEAMCGRQRPRCADEECKTPFPEESLVAGIEGGATEVACDACGKKHAMRTPPDWFARLNPLMRLLVRESQTADTVARTVGAEGIAFHCYGCGGSLPVDGSQRVMECPYCRNSITVPDEIWVRLNPVSAKVRWYAVLDVGDGAGIMPRETDEFCDIHLAPDGTLVALYHAEDDGEAGHPCRVARFDSTGLARWMQDGIEFQDSAELMADPSSGNVWLVDKEGEFMRLIDIETGDPITTVTGTRSDEAEVLKLEYAHLAADHDGTFLHSSSRHGLRRFDRAGNQTDLWGASPEPVKRGILSRLFGAVVEGSRDAPEFSALGDRPRRLPDESQIRIGPHGRLYVLSTKADWLAVYERNGTKISCAETGAGNLVDDLEDWDVDGQGRLFVLFEHSERIRDSHYANLARVIDGRFQTWLGPHAPNEEPFIGQYPRHLAVAADGSTVVAYDFEQMRRLSPDGKPTWLSPGTAERDSYQIEELAENRKGKKSVSDRGE